MSSGRELRLLAPGGPHAPRQTQEPPPLVPQSDVGQRADAPARRIAVIAVQSVTIHRARSVPMHHHADHTCKALQPCTPSKQPVPPTEPGLPPHTGGPEEAQWAQGPEAALLQLHPPPHLRRSSPTRDRVGARDGTQSHQFAQQTVRPVPELIPWTTPLPRAPGPAAPQPGLQQPPEPQPSVSAAGLWWWEMWKPAGSAVPGQRVRGLRGLSGIPDWIGGPGRSGRTTLGKPLRASSLATGFQSGV